MADNWLLRNRKVSKRIIVELTRRNIVQDVNINKVEEEEEGVWP